MNAVIYARYSSDRQTEQSIEGQLHDCYEFAKKRNFTVIKEYIDRAMSGRYDDRPDFQQMIKDAAKHQFQYIIVWKLDRFARNRYDSAIYKHKLKQHGVKVLSAMEGISEEPEGVILEAILEANAEYYSANLAQNVRRGMRESAQKGNSTGGTIPLGYKIEDKRLVIDEKTAPIVRCIFELYAAGKGKKEIADILNERGYRTRKGNLFTINSFNVILKNKKYIGIYHYKDQNEGEIIIEGACPAIIDKEIFDICAKKLQKNNRSPAHKKAKVEYLLQDKLFCGYCGAPMLGDCGTGKNKKRYHYYSCTTRRQNHSCKKKNEKKDFIEWYIVEQTIEYILRPDRLNYIADRIVQEYNSSFTEKQIKDLEYELTLIDKEQEKIVDALINTQSQSIINKMNERAEILEERQAALHAELSGLRVIVERRPTIEAIKHWLLNFCKGDLFDLNFRRRIIDVLINSIYLFDDKIAIYYNTKDAKQISYIEMADDIKKFDARGSCSDLLCDGVPRNMLSEHTQFIFHCDVFGCIIHRD